MNVPLEGVPFVIIADLSVDYPFKPPKIKFESKVGSLLSQFFRKMHHCADHSS